MTKATYNLNVMLIRMAKGSIKAWEAWVRESNETGDSIELPPPSGRIAEAATAFLRGEGKRTT